MASQNKTMIGKVMLNEKYAVLFLVESFAPPAINTVSGSSFEVKS
jgi:hypothetical protein